MSQTLLVRHKDFLPITPMTPMITLGEGNTPLVRAANLERGIACGALYLKLEGCNPTGSFKDRGMVMVVAKALEEGSRAIMCASTGNTSASAAAYAAHCGLTAIVIIPKVGVALGKLVQALLHGAKVLSIEGSFDEALDIVRHLTDKHPVTLVNSVNPYRIEGQKTAAFEIVDALGDAPDYLFLPVGNAGNITAYWKGFVEYQQAGRCTRRPRMIGIEAEGAAPIVSGQVVKEPKTVATAIRIGNPAHWQGALEARDQSGGTIDTVTDQEIMEAYRLLASKEGIFAEPASAASLAGLIKLSRKGMELVDRKVVCVLTGMGLKDPETAREQIEDISTVAADAVAIERSLGWG